MNVTGPPFCAPSTPSPLPPGHTSHRPPARCGLACLAVFGGHNTPPELHPLRPPTDPKCQMSWPLLGLLLLDSETSCTGPLPSAHSPLASVPPASASSFLPLGLVLFSLHLVLPSSSLSLRLSGPLGGSHHLSADGLQILPSAQTSLELQIQ